MILRLGLMDLRLKSCRRVVEESPPLKVTAPVEVEN